MVETSLFHLDDPSEDRNEELRRDLELKIARLNMLRERLARAERSVKLRSKISKYMIVLSAFLMALSCMKEFSPLLMVGLVIFALSILPHLFKRESPDKMEKEMRLLANEIMSMKQRIKEASRSSEAAELSGKLLGKSGA